MKRSRLPSSEEEEDFPSSKQIEHNSKFNSPLSCQASFTGPPPTQVALTQPFPRTPLSLETKSGKGSECHSAPAESRSSSCREPLFSPYGCPPENENGIQSPLTVYDIISLPLEEGAARLRGLPWEVTDGLKRKLRDMLGSPEKRDSFANLQKLMLDRKDVSSSRSLANAHKGQLEILVAVRTGIQAFLHPDINITHAALVDIFLQKRCRNVACQSQLPADDCQCTVCSSKTGFCNLCMCLVCNKFDFDANTCRWIGCDFCLHWCHTDCALKMGYIAMGPCPSGRTGSMETQFRCTACAHTSELYGFVKDVFTLCAGGWDKDVVCKELDCVARIFGGAVDGRGKMLLWKAQNLLNELTTNGMSCEKVTREMQHFFALVDSLAEREKGGSEGKSNGETRQSESGEQGEPCNRIAAVVREAVIKMEAEAKGKAEELRKAKQVLDLYDKELDQKRRDAVNLQIIRQKDKQQVQDLQSIVKMKQAEARVLQMKADEMRREAEGILTIIMAKSEAIEEDYATQYLRLRLDEAEAKRKVLHESVQNIERAKIQLEQSKAEMLGSVKNLLNRVDSSNQQSGTTVKSTPP